MTPLLDVLSFSPDPLDLSTTAGRLNARLDRLFEAWKRRYPKELQGDFHADGIVDEAMYDRQTHRLLFVALEPNSKGGRFDQFRGWDLRALWRDRPLKKAFDRNAALWTRALLDGRDDYSAGLAPERTRCQLARIAIINLKKTAGGGRAAMENIAIQAWEHRDLLREQVRIISPEVVVTGGQECNRLFWKIMFNDPFGGPAGLEPWKVDRVVVLPGNHPSVRPGHARDALERLVRLAKQAKVGAYSK